MSTGLNVDAHYKYQDDQQQKQYEHVNVQTDRINNYDIPQQSHTNEEQQQDQQIDYKVDKLLPKQNQKEKLIQQNIKLKTQIYQLAVQLDEILAKDKQRKKKYGMSIEDEDEMVKAKKLQLKRQQLQIAEAKNKIFQLKRQLQSIFNIQLVQQRQDILRHVKRKLQEVEDQKDGLVKIKKGQTKAIKTVKNQQQYKERIDKTHKQFVRLKQQGQKLKQKTLQAKKEEIACHQKYVIKQQKIRQLENKLAVTAKSIKEKQKVPNAGNKDTISNELINELQQEIKRLQTQKTKGEKIWQQKIRAVELELQSRRQEEQKKLLILRQKQKQSKLNQLRIRELRKLVKQNINQENTKRGQDMDMSQFRHRRNIKYVQK